MKNSTQIMIGIVGYLLFIGLQLGIGIPWLFSQNYIPFFFIPIILAFLVTLTIVVTIELNVLITKKTESKQ